VPVLPPDSEPLRVLHISDLHMMPGQKRKQAWVRELTGTDPDLVIVTGDNMAHPDAITGVARALRPLMDRPGAFVFGSNDYRGPVFKNPLGYFSRDREYVQGAELPAEELRDLFVASGWADLNNARTAIKAGGRAVSLVGVDDPHIERDAYDAVAGPAAPDADLTIGLTHSPEPRILDAMAADGYALLLAGHTHGGQVRVPGYGALVTNCGLDRRMARGLHRWPGGGGRSWLHVSAGLGTHPTAPIRFSCPPEASLLTLIPR
jgi:predicted MPP superfamily phosphohydrolase